MEEQPQEKPNIPQEYLSLLDKAFSAIDKEDLKVEKVKLPFPVCSRASKWTMIDNFKAICDIAETKNGHIKKYFEQELCANATILKGGILKIKGRFTFTQMQTILKKYVMLYVVCEYCKTNRTHLHVLPGKVLHKVCDQCKHTSTVPHI